MLTVRSTINIASQTVPPIIPVVQGDTGRAILFTLADFTIPAGATATYYVQKPSGEAVYNNATIDGNNVLVELTAQSIIEKGDNYGQVRITVGEEVVTSFDFILLVKEFRGIDAVQSLTEMNIFDKAVEQASEAIDEVKTDALEAIDDAKDEAIEEVTSNFDLKLDASSTKGVQNQVITQAINTVNNAIGDLSGETVTPTATNNYGVGGNVGQVIETWATTEYWHGIYTVSAGNTYGITTVSDFPQQIVVWFTNSSNVILEIHKAFATDHVEMVCTAPTGATKLFVMSYGYDAYHGTVQKVEPLSETVSNLKDDFSDISEYGSENVCPVKSGSYSPLTITVVADGKGNYTINGTASGGNAHFNLFSDSSSFPTGIKAGDKILAKVNSTNTAIRFYVMWWVNGSKVETDANWLSDGYKYFDIPSNATGMEIRLTVRNGTATNNDVLTPFIFADKTKYEFNQEIDKNATDIALVTSHMPMGYSPMEVTAISGLVNKWNEMVTPTGYAYVKQAVNVGETYKVSGWYYGGNFPAYLFLNGSSVVSFHNTDATGAFKNIEVTVPATATHIVINGYTDCPASIADYGMVDAGGADSRDSVVVGVGDSYNYNNINTAVTENTGRIVAVDYGTYETEIENLATNKTIIGKDVDLCVLTGTNKDYDHPPIEIAGGIIKHFTVNMQNNSSAEHKGYCLHSDHSNCANNKLVVTDCDFSCTGQHSIGMGIYPSEEVIFKNCTFDQLDNTNESVPFFCHNSGSSDGVGVVRFHNCYFKGYGNCMKLQGWGSNASIQFEFIDCTFISETYGTTDDCVWTDYVSGSTHDASRMHEFSGKFTLLASSHGNNVSVLNA